MAKKKQKTYPKSRPEKQYVRKSTDGDKVCKHCLVPIDKPDGAGNKVTMIQKSTVFSFNSVPDKSIEEYKGLW